jgi:hypothetical protein
LLKVIRTLYLRELSQSPSSESWTPRTHASDVCLCIALPSCGRLSWNWKLCLCLLAANQTKIAGTCLGTT